MQHFKVKTLPKGCCKKYEISVRHWFKYRPIKIVYSFQEVINYFDELGYRTVVHYE